MFSTKPTPSSRIPVLISSHAQQIHMKQYGLLHCVVDALLLAAVVCGLLKETRCSIMIAYTLNKVSLLVTHSMNMLVQIMQRCAWLTATSLQPSHAPSVHVQ